MTASTDPSSRFVLNDDAPYLANLAALWHTHPALARQVENPADADPGAGAARLTVEPSRSGPPTLTARTADGRAISFHSPYDPQAEAVKLVDAARTDACVAYYLLGMGLG